MIMEAHTRVLVWFSCGAASAVAARMIVEKYPHAEVLYCNTLKREHPDNVRFMRDVERWIGRKIKLLTNSRYNGDIYEVFDKTGWLVGPGGGTLYCRAQEARQARLPIA